MDQHKTCARCKASKAREDFPPGKRWADGLYPYCRDCKRAVQRADHAKHKAVRNERMNAHYVANKDAYKARAKAAYVADPEAGKRRATAWAVANPERRHEIQLSSFRRRYALDPEPKRETWRRRNAAIRRGCAVYPFTPEQLAAKVAYWGGRCWICSAPYEAIDHVKPLAKMGPHMLANLRPICTSCNTRKKDRWPFLAA